MSLAAQKPKEGDSMNGKDLIDTLTQSSDVPPELISTELRRLLEQNHIAENQVTLDQLRELLAEYLQDVFISAKRELKR